MVKAPLSLAGRGSAALYSAAMTDRTPIPPSPSEDDYVAQVSGAEPPALLSETDPFALFDG